MLRRENPRFNPKQFGQVKFRSNIFCTRNGSIDCQQRLLKLPGLAQAFRRRADEARDLEIVLLSLQGLQLSISISKWDWRTSRNQSVTRNESRYVFGFN
jgi:hypothetical protein